MDRKDEGRIRRMNPRVAVLLGAMLLAAAGLALALVRNWPTSSPTTGPTEGDAKRFRGFSLDFMAPYYDSLLDLLGVGSGFRRRTVELARIRAGERVLDVGCGTGELDLYERDAVGAAGYVAGIDIGTSLIEVARTKARKAGKRIDFQVASIESLPFPAESFDVVTSSMMMHHLPTEVKRAGLAEVFRVLKPGGRLVIVDFGPSSPIFDLAVRLLSRLLFFVPELTYVQDNLDGKIPVFVKDAGFSDLKIIVEPRFPGLPLPFILARKPY